jgi:hypothetical protein
MNENRLRVKELAVGAKQTVIGSVLMSRGWSGQGARWADREDWAPSLELGAAWWEGFEIESATEVNLFAWIALQLSKVRWLMDCRKQAIETRLSKPGDERTFQIGKNDWHENHKIKNETRQLPMNWT